MLLFVASRVLIRTYRLRISKKFVNDVLIKKPRPFNYRKGRGYQGVKIETIEPPPYIKVVCIEDLFRKNA